jgi:hypothetical protein
MYCNKNVLRRVLNLVCLCWALSYCSVLLLVLVVFALCMLQRREPRLREDLVGMLGRPRQPQREFHWAAKLHAHSEHKLHRFGINLCDFAQVFGQNSDRSINTRGLKLAQILGRLYEFFVLASQRAATRGVESRIWGGGGDVSGALTRPTCPRHRSRG